MKHVRVSFFLHLSLVFATHRICYFMHILHNLYIKEQKKITLLMEHANHKSTTDHFCQETAENL